MAEAVDPMAGDYDEGDGVSERDLEAAITADLGTNGPFGAQPEVERLAVRLARNGSRTGRQTTLLGRASAGRRWYRWRGTSWWRP